MSGLKSDVGKSEIPQSQWRHCQGKKILAKAIGKRRGARNALALRRKGKNVTAGGNKKKIFSLLLRRKTLTVSCLRAANKLGQWSKRFKRISEQTIHRFECEKKEITHFQISQRGRGCVVGTGVVDGGCIWKESSPSASVFWWLKTTQVYSRGAMMRKKEWHNRKSVWSLSRLMSCFSEKRGGGRKREKADGLLQGWENYSLGATWGPFSFLIEPAKLKSIYAITFKLKILTIL